MLPYIWVVKKGILIKIERKNIRLQVELISHDAVKEKFRVLAKNTCFTLESNRPLLLSKGLKYKPVNWKIVDGGYTRTFIVDLITKEIEKLNWTF